MTVASRSFCDNCNAECGHPRFVKIAWSEWPDGTHSQNLSHELCEDCARTFAELDLARFVERHEVRPRSVQLP